MAANSKAAILLMRQLKELKNNTDSGFSAGLIDDSNPFEWQVILAGPRDTCYDGGLFKATLSFPLDYPYMPPTMRFTSQMWHPNIHNDGKVCISILHAPGTDPNQYENASERWLPVHTVESILVSVISLLSCPNSDSAANLDAAKEMRETPNIFKKKVGKTVQRSLEDS